MRTRVGIELSRVACRLVELEGRSVDPGQPPTTRVLSYAVLPPSGPETERRLAALGRRPVAVVVWGVRNERRQVVVSNGSYEKMRTEALVSARFAGVDTRRAIADVATASSAIKGADRQPVILALANVDDVSAAVRPLLNVGVRIRSLITPADALLGLARSRQAFAVPGGLEAYVALDETATCVALVRDGSLLGARELPWGYADGTSASAPSAEAPRRDDLAARLVEELTDFVTAVGADDGGVAQVSICSGLPELRTMTVPLMEQLDVEVEALDSLFGIDVEHLPEPAEGFREQASALRLAWAAGAGWRGPINLMRYRRRRNRRVAVARAAVVAGVAAGLGTWWAIEQSAWWQAPPPQQVARRTPAATPSVASPAPARGVATGPATPNAPAPPRALVQPAPIAVAPAIAATMAAGADAPVLPPDATPVPVARSAPLTPPTATPPFIHVAPPAVAPPVMRVATPPAMAPSTARVTTPAPAAVPPATAAVSSPTPVTTPVAPQSATPSPSAVIAPARGSVEGGASASRQAQPATGRAEEMPVPFDAVLGTILFSPDRQLAIVNGRIVGPGDSVNGARIVDITSGTVLLRDAQGRLRSLTLGALDRSGTAPQ